MLYKYEELNELEDGTILFGLEKCEYVVKLTTYRGKDGFIWLQKKSKNGSMDLHSPEEFCLLSDDYNEIHRYAIPKQSTDPKPRKTTDKTLTSADIDAKLSTIRGAKKSSDPYNKKSGKNDKYNNKNNNYNSPLNRNKRKYGSNGDR